MTTKTATRNSSSKAPVAEKTPEVALDVETLQDWRTVLALLPASFRRTIPAGLRKLLLMTAVADDATPEHRIRVEKFLKRVDRDWQLTCQKEGTKATALAMPYHRLMGLKAIAANATNAPLALVVEPIAAEAAATTPVALSATVFELAVAAPRQVRRTKDKHVTIGNGFIPGVHGNLPNPPLFPAEAESAAVKVARTSAKVVRTGPTSKPSKAQPVVAQVPRGKSKRRS